MKYMILWKAFDQPTLFDSEEYASEAEAKAALEGFHSKFRWNSYLLVRVEDSKHGDAALKPHPFGPGRFILD